MTDVALAGSHDPLLVALSVSVAIVASFCALDLSGRMRAASGPGALAWLAAAAVAMGGGIWSMHFIAMLAFRLPVPTAYDPGLTTLSLVIPVLVTGLAFAVVRRRGGWGRDIALGGLIMGSGIAAMHYIGMAAMRQAAHLHHDVTLVLLSVLIAIGASTVALWLSLRDTDLPARSAASVAMGLAVAGMHYTAMAGATWNADGGATDAALPSQAGFEHINLAVAVATATFAILAVALVAALLDRRFAAVARKEGELALRESEARAASLSAERSAILGQLAEGVIVTDTGGRITFFNEAANRIHGGDMRLEVGPGEYSGAYRLYTEEGMPYPSHELPLARAVLHGEIVTEAGWRIRWPDGAEVFAVGSARPLRGADGLKIGAVLTIRDETSRAVAEAALRENAARLRVALEAADLGTWELDFATERMSWDATLAALLGLDGERHEEAVTKWSEVIHPDDRDRVLQAFLTSADARLPCKEEYRILRPDDGRERVVVSRGILTRPGRMVGTTQDVTDARAAEAVLARDMVELERLVDSRTADLVRAAEERRRAEEAARQAEKLAALGQLTGGVAHDFNNLLQVVTSGAALLQLPDLSEAEKQSVLDGMIQAGQNARQVTGRLLAFARRQPLQPEVVDVEARLAGMSEMLRQTLGSGIRVVTDLEAGLWRVRVDPSQFEVAILNLAVNARDAMQRGGNLTIQARNANLETSADRHAGEYVCVAVKDTGTGMPAHLLDRVIEPFFTTKDSGKGTGLGLPQVHGFVQQSGGDLRIESELGQGTAVWFHLPRAAGVDGPDGRQAAAMTTAASGSPRRLGTTVLVVEDNPEIAAFACSLLERMGYRARHAQGATEALAALESGEPADLVFSDVMMPGGMTGVELAATLRRARPHLPVILATGYSEQLLKSGPPEGVETLYKPYHPDELGAAIQRAMARGEMVKAIAEEGGGAG